MRFVTHFRCEASESQEETKHPPPCAWRFRIPVSGVAPRWFSWGLAGAYQVQAEVAGLPGPTSERRLNYASLSHSLSGFHKCLTCREGQAPSESSQVPSCCCAHFWKAECTYTHWGGKGSSNIISFNEVPIGSFIFILWLHFVAYKSLVSSLARNRTHAPWSGSTES